MEYMPFIMLTAVCAVLMMQGPAEIQSYSVQLKDEAC